MAKPLSTKIDPICRLPKPAVDLSDWSAQLLALDPTPRQYRQHLQALKEHLFQAFDRGCYIDDLIKDMTRGVDQLLSVIWRQFNLDQHPGVALLAVGGYGRKEQHPASDIDILILIPEFPSETLQQKLSDFITFLWDLGVDLGHSTRSLPECLEEGRNDLSIATNLFEARLVAGSSEAFLALEDAINGPEFWPSVDFFHAKVQELKRRHERFGESGNQLEPNLKEGPGGLRDLQTIAWITKRHYEVDALRELIERGFILTDEYNTLCVGRDFLWKARFALHRLTGRKEDRLLFDHQRRLTSMLGFDGGGNPIKAVEDMMQQYYRTVTAIARMTEMLLQHFEEEICLRDQQESRVELNQRFLLRNGYIEVRHPELFALHPPSLLEVFLLLQQYPDAKGVRASTIRQIRRHLHLIDDAFRNDIICHSLFMDILRRPVGVYHEFKRMHTYGVLSRYIPAFENLVGRMQFDLFHLYTVDEHILMVLRYVRRLSDPRHKDEIPAASELFMHLRKPELLYLAALFHDIGKGRGGDHSTLGAVDAREFCLAHGIGEEDTQLIVWLVEQHLTMSMIAQRKDITDPDIINDFALTVVDQEHLDYLYLLTIADIRGTNPELWNGWRASLLAELYRRTSQWIDAMTSPDVSQAEIVADTRLTALRMLTEEDIDESEVIKVWQNLPPEYFRRHSPQTVVWHTHMLLAASPENDIQIEFMPRSVQQATKLAIYAKAHRRYFSLVTCTIAHFALNIVDARIFTIDDEMSLDTFSLLESDGSPCEDEIKLGELRNRLIEVLRNPELPPPPVHRRLPRRLKSFEVPVQIHIDNPEHRNYTQLEIIAQDRPGLLADIGCAIYAAGFEIQVARIATAGERAEDTLQITTPQHQPLSLPEQESLRETLLASLENFTS